jgi:hypothetical protein
MGHAWNYVNTKGYVHGIVDEESATIFKELVLNELSSNGIDPKKLDQYMSTMAAVSQGQQDMIITQGLTTNNPFLNGGSLEDFENALKAL